MTENAKTLICLGVAAVFALVAFVSRPTQQPLDPGEQVGKDLFATFDDPNEAASLEIVRYDEGLGEIYTFKVAKKSSTGVWAIPSHSDYPADAEEQMRDAATTLAGLKVLGIVTEEPSEHELFGVVEPSKDDLRMGDKGVGVLVVVQDEKGKDLARLVIGKEVRNQAEQRFVREPGRDLVYAVEIDPDKLSTKFEDWIEEDLLQLSSFDIERLRLRDYSVVQTLQGGALELRSDVITNWDSSDSKWNLEQMATFRGREEVPTELLPGEELDTSKLNDMKTALDDLKIVDVRRKPAGLGTNLRADNAFLENEENRRSLRSRGFYPNPTPDGEFELLAANGEVHVGMKDGFDYVLRFGNVAGTEEGSEEGKLNRYLLVMARVDESKFPMPELEALPEAPVGPPEADAAPAPPADENRGEAAPEAEDQSDCGPQESAGQDEADAPQPPPADPPAADPPAAADEQPAEPDAPAADDQPAPPAADTATEQAREAEQEQRRKVEAERQRITKENQRKLDEWKEKKQKAEEKVRELNARFADWYYVISEDTYKKIHLSRSDIIKESESVEEEGFGVDAFRKLQQDGLGADAAGENP